MRNTLGSVKVLPSQQWMRGMTGKIKITQFAFYHSTFSLFTNSTSIGDNTTVKNTASDKHGDVSYKIKTSPINSINVVSTRSDVNTIPFHSSIAPQKMENINFSANINVNANIHLDKTTTTSETSETSSQSASSQTRVSESAPPPTMTNTNVNTILNDNELIDELRRVVNRPLFIGDLFRNLTPAAKKTFVKKKMTLEEFLLRHPTYFAVYRTGRVSMQYKRIRVMLMVAPPFLVPENAEIVPPIVDENLESEQTITNSYSHNNSSNQETSSLAEANAASKTEDNKIHVDPTSHTEVQSATSEKSTTTSFPDSKAVERRMNSKEQLTLKERMETVLQYIPNEFESFTKLKVPRAVKVRCMNYPLTTPLSFFKKYPQYFEVTDIDLTIGSFKIRRSLTLQKRIEAYVKNHESQKLSKKTSLM